MVGDTDTSSRHSGRRRELSEHILKPQAQGRVKLKWAKVYLKLIPRMNFL